MGVCGCPGRAISWTTTRSVVVRSGTVPQQPEEGGTDSIAEQGKYTGPLTSALCPVLVGCIRTRVLIGIAQGTDQEQCLSGLQEKQPTSKAETALC